MVPPRLWTIRNGATDGPRFDGLPLAPTLIELQNVLGIAAETARAFDVLAVNVNAIFGMVAKVRERDRDNTNGP